MQLRNLPSVDAVLANPDLAEVLAVYRRDWIVELVRRCLDELRVEVRAGADAPDTQSVACSVSRVVEEIITPVPRRVINATGVVIHTNLGRAPLSHAATHAATQAALGYSDLEMDINTGRRGSRQAHLQALLRELTGAEAALVVNNNASAVLLGLSALAAGKEVIVSRAEAIEIGGGFRIPDVLRQSGAVLVDVGTTNRTYVRDYADAINENTGALVKAHASNFRVEGFTAAVSSEELVELGNKRGVPVLNDVGSGCLLDCEKYGLAHEPTPQESAAAGVGLTFFSGDKLLGGPQAGIIVGKRDLVQQLERHPLARAFRIDKMSLAGLITTLTHYLKHEAEQEIPIWRMISASEQSVRARAESWVSRLEASAEVVGTRSAVGGGSLPGETLPTWALALKTGSADLLMGRLRQSDPPIIGRVEADRVLLDPRTVLPEEDEALLQGVSFALVG